MLSTSFHDVMNNLHIQISMSVSLEHITAVLILRATIPKDRATAFRLKMYGDYQFPQQSCDIQNKLFWMLLQQIYYHFCLLNL